MKRPGARSPGGEEQARDRAADGRGRKRGALAAGGSAPLTWRRKLGHVRGSAEENPVPPEIGKEGDFSEII